MANATISLEDRTFGCEFEVYLPYAAAAELGELGYHDAVQVPDLARGWKAKTDSSLDAAPPGMTGVEFVSPVLRGEDGLRQVIAACEWLKSRGARVNSTCGFHVHVGFSPERMDALGRLVCLTARHEEGLFAVTGSRRRRGAQWCQSIKDSHRAEKLRRKFKEGRQDESLPMNHSERYVTLNVTNLAAGVRDAVEYRVFAGTTNALKAIMHIRLCLGLVQRAEESNRKVAWDAELSPSDAAKFKARGNGTKALVNLLLSLGWYRGNQPKVYGAVEADGVPTLARCVAEARRLAAKYDGDAEEAD